MLLKTVLSLTLLALMLDLDGVEAGTPTPDAWGLPTSNFQGDCNLNANFINQQIVFVVTFCGDWAGNTWNNSCAAKTGVSSCAAYVGDNPSAFVDMWGTFTDSNVLL